MTACGAERKCWNGSLPAAIGGNAENIFSPRVLLTVTQSGHEPSGFGYMRSPFIPIISAHSGDTRADQGLAADEPEGQAGILAKIINLGRYVAFQMDEVAVIKNPFAQNGRRLDADGRTLTAVPQVKREVEPFARFQFSPPLP
jgi:hypothetical protein